MRRGDLGLGSKRRRRQNIRPPADCDLLAGRVLRRCLEHGRACAPWNHAVSREALQAYGDSPIRLSLELPSKPPIDPLGWLVGERLDGFQFYMCTVERAEESRFVYARCADELACKWRKAAAADERLSLLFVVTSVGSSVDELARKEGERTLAAERDRSSSSFDEYLLKRFSE